MTKRKKIALILGGIAAVPLLTAGILLKELYDYMEAVPDITLYAESITVPVNTELTASDLADVRKSTYTTLGVSDWDSARPTLYNRTLLNSGEECGTFTVTIDAMGTNAEHTCASVKIYVVEETE